MYEELPFIINSVLLSGGFMSLWHRVVNNTNTFTNFFFDICWLSVIFMLLACITVNVVKRKSLVRGLLYLIPLTLVIVNVWLRLSLNTDISTNILMVVMETNGSEISGFIDSFLFTKETAITCGILILLILYIIFTEHFYRKIKHNKRIVYIISACCTIIAVIGCLCSINYYVSLFKSESLDDAVIIEDEVCHTDIPLKNLIFSGFNLYLSSKEIPTIRAITEETLKSADIECYEQDSLDVIFVVGESYIKWHSGLYGYYLNTTPRMEEERQRGNLLVYNKVSTPSNLTSIVLKNVLSCNNFEKGEKWYEYPYFLSFFKKAGYRVDYWDNQFAWNKEKAFVFALNSLLYDRRIVKMSYDEINDKCFDYDGDFVEDYFKHTVPQKHNFVFLHLMGQHVGFSDRYPREYSYFSADSILRTDSWITADMKKEIAAYDNATRYNDHVIGKIIDRYKNSNTVIVYFSDHGEEVYDYRPSMGRDMGDMMTNELRKYQYEIPFVVWFSDKFKRNYPDKISALKKNVNKAFDISNVYNTLFSLGCIKTSRYDLKEDLTK